MTLPNTTISSSTDIENKKDVKVTVSSDLEKLLANDKSIDTALSTCENIVNGMVN